MPSEDSGTWLTCMFPPIEHPFFYSWILLMSFFMLPKTLHVSSGTLIFQIFFRSSCLQVFGKQQDKILTEGALRWLGLSDRVVSLCLPSALPFQTAPGCCNDIHVSSAGTCEATRLSATAVPSGWWPGWRTQTPRCQMQRVPGRRPWRTSASMIWTACKTIACQQVSDTWVRWPCLLPVLSGDPTGV